MSTVKTAVSLEKSLFDQVDALARKLKVNRSRLFAMALEDFFKRYESRQLLERINEAHKDAPDPAERLWLRKMRRVHRKIVEGEW